MTKNEQDPFQAGFIIPLPVAATCSIFAASVWQSEITPNRNSLFPIMK
jgi:hypothetical protein